MNWNYDLLRINLLRILRTNWSYPLVQIQRLKLVPRQMTCLDMDIVTYKATDKQQTSYFSSEFIVVFMSEPLMISIAICLLIFWSNCNLFLWFKQKFDYMETLINQQQEQEFVVFNGLKVWIITQQVHNTWNGVESNHRTLSRSCTFLSSFYL